VVPAEEFVLKITGATQSVGLSSVRETTKRDLSAEAEGSPMLETVARKRLVKTQQAGKGLAGAVVICESWRLAMAL
jgi:hypothetical protein